MTPALHLNLFYLCFGAGAFVGYLIAGEVFARCYARVIK